jgi:hypothetical protein
MDAAAAAAALQELLARRKSQPSAGNGPKPTTLELVDQYEEAQEEDSEDGVRRHTTPQHGTACWGSLLTCPSTEHVSWAAAPACTVL